MACLGNNVDIIVPVARQSWSQEFRKIKLSGLDVMYADYTVMPKLLFSRFLVWKFINELEAHIDFSRYQVISMHMFDEYLLNVFIQVAKRYRLKIVVHFHGLNVIYEQEPPLLHRVLQYRGTRIYKKLMKNVDCIVGVSNKVCDLAQKQYPGCLGVTVYNGADITLFKQKDSNDADGAVNILCVGNLNKTKGQHLLIQAVSDILKSTVYLKLQLHLIGDGPMLDKLKRLVSELNIDEHVVFHGVVSYEQVAEQMRKSDIFVLPSYYEALGCVYLEAMASKLPTIGCLSQGIEEIIEDGKNGLLVKPNDVNSITEKLLLVINDHKLGKSMAEQARRDICVGYTWEDSAKALEAVYDSLLYPKKQR